MFESVRIKEYNIMYGVVDCGGCVMDYLTTAEFAKKWGISQRRVGIYCKEGRLQGAIIKGKTWLIPSDSFKPEDPRKKKIEEIKSGGMK